MFRRRRAILAFAVGLLAARAAGAAAPARIARTLAALDELERVCQQAEKGGNQALYSRIPLVVERQVLVELDAAHKERDEILDHIYESCTRARAAVLDGSEARRPRVPSAPDLERITLKDGFLWEGESLVFPVVADRCPAALRPFFARGELRRCIPALAGATAENFHQTELARLYKDEPAARREGWDRPAGGFVCDGALVCLDHPAVRQAIADEAAKALAALPKEGRPLYISLGTEPFYTDYSALSRARFLAWVKEHYKSVRILNLAWGTEVADFGPDLLPTPDQAAASPPRWADFADFNHARLTEHVRWAAGNVRAAAPGLLLGLAPFRYAFAGSFALSGADPLALAESLDVLELCGSGPMEADLAFALAGGKRLVVNPAFVPGSFGVIPHQLHGCAALRLPAWPRNSLTSIQAIREAEAVMRDALDARRLAPQCARLARAPKPMAILYSQASLRLAPQWALRCSLSPYTHELATAYQAARFLDLGLTFVPSRDFARARWEGIRLLIVPAAHAEEEPIVKGILEFVELGGHLVVIAESFVTDERGREADGLARLGLEVIETRRPSYETKARPDLGGALDDLVVAEPPGGTPLSHDALKPSPDGPLARLKRPLSATGLTQKIKVNVAHKTLATFADRSPAIVTFARGRGTVTYLAAPLAPSDLAAVLRIAVAQAGIEPLVRLVPLEGEATGIECRAVQDGSVILAYAWNTTEKACRVAFEAGPVTSAIDLSTGRPLPLQADKAGSVLGPMSLGPGEVAILQLGLPHPKAP